MRKLAVVLFVALAGFCMAAPANAQPYGYGYGAYTEVDAAIDSVGLPPIFHYIAERESGDNPYAVNPYSGACGPFQFMPETAYYMDTNCYALTDPYFAAQKALELYQQMGLSPWSLTAY
jgi:hypothetical protein